MASASSKPADHSRLGFKAGNLDQVLLHFNDGMKQIVALDGSTVRLRHGSFLSKKLVGQTYGSVWELTGKDIVLVAGGQFEAHTDIAEVDADDDGQWDNREIVDTNTAQELAPEDIESMRKDGVSGSAIVASLVQHSATFAVKTAYSKEKYLRRKAAKHVHRFRLLKSTASLVCEMLRERQPEKIGWLRGDSLGQMLSTANVRAGATVLVMDGMGGIVTGAVAERMVVARGSSSSIDGTLICAREDRANAPNLTHAEKLHVAQALKGHAVTGVTYGEIARLAAANADQDNAEASAGSGTKRKRAQGDARSPGCAALLRGVDSVIVAIPGDPTHALIASLRYCKPSCSFAVFSLDLSTLGKLQRTLKHLEAAACTHVTEAWTREYQVLPDRTHPTMMTDGLSGYILSGTVINHAWLVPRAVAQPPAARASGSSSTAGQPAAMAGSSSQAQVGGVVSASASVAFMRQACELADKCEPVQTAYNVGAVLVSLDGRVLATGYSRELPGNTHAEEVCLTKLEGKVGAGATMYTTMEPCSKRLSGKTSCTDLIIAAGVKRVVLAIQEPPAFVLCEGIRLLREAGVQVEVLGDADCASRASAANSHIKQPL